MTDRPSRSVRLGALVLSATLLGAGLVSCGQRREPARGQEIDPNTRARLGLTEDALDPTVRDKEAGYGMWRAKPEPTGTRDPLSPERRKIDGPDW